MSKKRKSYMEARSRKGDKVQHSKNKKIKNWVTR